MIIINYFDCNCVLGRRRLRNPGSFFDTGELLRKMEYYGVEKALAYHSMAREYSPAVGNAMLSDEIKDKPWLLGVWIALPHIPGDFPEPARLRAEMKQNNIKAVRLFPSDCNFSLSRWCGGELLDMLAETKTPLMIDLNQIYWEGLHSLLSSTPGLRVILTAVGNGKARFLYPLLKLFPNLYVESMGIKDIYGIEEICGLFGAERLIFGSGAPVYSEGSAISMISHAQISEGEKQKIASGNLEALLAGVKL